MSRTARGPYLLLKSPAAACPNARHYSATPDAAGLLPLPIERAETWQWIPTHKNVRVLSCPRELPAHIGTGGTQLLTRCIGRSRSLEVMLSAQDVPRSRAS